MSLSAAVGLVLVCAAAQHAAADRAIAVEVNAGAPFDAAELRRALALRLPPDGARVELRVALATDGIVHVTAGERVRDVDVAGLHGEAAARLVALAASDLLLDDLADAPPPSPRTDRSAPIALGAAGIVSTWPHAFAGGAASLMIGANRTLVAVELGGATLVGADLHMSAVTGRIGAGVRWHDFVELRAGVTLAPLFVSDGAGDRTILLGGHATARLRLPLWHGTHAVVAAGADVFATRTEYRMTGTTIFATPRFAPSLALGIEVTP